MTSIPTSDGKSAGTFSSSGGGKQEKSNSIASQLAEDLFSCAQTIRPFLAPQRSLYLFRALPNLLSDLLMRSVISIIGISSNNSRRLNKAEVNLLVRASLTIQQSIWTILIEEGTNGRHMNQQSEQDIKDQLSAFDGVRLFFRAFLHHKNKRTVTRDLENIEKLFASNIIIIKDFFR